MPTRHGMACLLHEKPFAGVNGSGKHNNWSICTPTRGKPAGPRQNAHGKRCSSCCSSAAVIKAVDEYQDLLRVTGGHRGQRPSPGRQRSAAGHHLYFCGRRAGQPSLNAIASGADYMATGQDAHGAGCGYPAHVLHRIRPTATAPPRSPSPAINSNSACRAVRHEHRRRQHRAEHRSCRRAEKAMPTSWRTRRISTRAVIRTGRSAPSATTSASSSTATVTAVNGNKRRKSAACAT